MTNSMSCKTAAKCGWVTIVHSNIFFLESYSSATTLQYKHSMVMKLWYYKAIMSCNLLSCCNIIYYNFGSAKWISSDSLSFPFFQQKKGGGISFNSTLPLTKCNEKMVQLILHEWSILADLLFKYHYCRKQDIFSFLLQLTHFVQCQSLYW